MVQVYSKDDNDDTKLEAEKAIVELPFPAGVDMIILLNVVGELQTTQA